MSRTAVAKEKLLNAALGVIREKGYAATTVDDLCARAGVTKGAFFHHFKSKDALGVAAAQHWSTVTGALFERAPYHDHPDPLDRVLAYIDFRRALLDGAIPEVTCVVGTMVQETYSQYPAIREACAASIFGHASTLVDDIRQAMAQRIVRAKRSLTAARVPFEVPDATQRNTRLASVLEVIYLVFNEGYAATAGEDWMRPALCDEAMRLGRVLARLMPRESEVHGLLALMEIQASRSAARVDPHGRPVRLAEQDRSRWDHLLIQRGLAALARSEQLGGARGPYALQAALAACHARARSAEATDWPQIVALYDALAQVAPSPVVELNRAVAVGMVFGPQAALEIVDALAGDPTLGQYHWLPSVRGDLLEKLDRREEARAEFTRAASLTRNTQEQDFLLRRAQQAIAPGRIS